MNSMNSAKSDDFGGLGLDGAEAENIFDDWRNLGRNDQHAPKDMDWSVWLVLGGRGSGKTRTGSEWVLQQVEAGARRIAIVGPTLHDAREVMLGGDSGLLLWC